MTTTARRWPLRRILAVAFAAMFAQDVLGTSMVIFEAHYHAGLAAVMDEAQWATGLICTGLAIESIIRDGWRSRRTWAVCAAISAANIAGTWTGVTVGHLAAR